MWSEFEKRQSPAGVLMMVDESRLSAGSKAVIVRYNKTGRFDAERYLRAVDEARLIGSGDLCFGDSPLVASHRVVLGRSALGRILR